MWILVFYILESLVWISLNVLFAKYVGTLLKLQDISSQFAFKDPDVLYSSKVVKMKSCPGFQIFFEALEAFQKNDYCLLYNIAEEY